MDHRGETDDHPALFGAKGRVGKGTTRRNMGALKFERLPRHLRDTYQSNGGKLALHIDNATCHSRRSGHRVSHIEVEEGGLAERGGIRRL